MIRLKMTRIAEFADEKAYRDFLKVAGAAGVPNDAITKLRNYEGPQEWDEGPVRAVFDVERVIDLPEGGVGN